MATATMRAEPAMQELFGFNFNKPKNGEILQPFYSDVAEAFGGYRDQLAQHKSRIAVHTGYKKAYVHIRTDGASSEEKTAIVKTMQEIGGALSSRGYPVKVAEISGPKSLHGKGIRLSGPLTPPFISTPSETHLRS